MTNDQIEWSDAEREAVPCTRACVDRRALGRRKHSPICDENRATILRALAPHVAAREAQAAAKALREAANRWQQGGWADDLPSKGAGRTEGIIGMAHRATAFLRDRADRIERGES